ncbi:hypothetical protein FQA47_023890 [Oryzias melastigma]|uniref:Uncharacterized protein n=1 Tax=Oryzias melastigma TaxID=30732 RepID=A0A834F1Z6_ORYME|nr:hypothetical protein FQA47_023890 [Oryzias melastigma]
MCVSPYDLWSLRNLSVSREMLVWTLGYAARHLEELAPLSVCAKSQLTVLLMVIHKSSELKSSPVLEPECNVGQQSSARHRVHAMGMRGPVSARELTWDCHGKWG